MLLSASECLSIKRTMTYFLENRDLRRKAGFMFVHNSPPQADISAKGVFIYQDTGPHKCQMISTEG